MYNDEQERAITKATMDLRQAGWEVDREIYDYNNSETMVVSKPPNGKPFNFGTLHLICLRGELVGMHLVPGGVKGWTGEDLAGLVKWIINSENAE